MNPSNAVLAEEAVPSIVAQTPAPESHALSFSGSGKEYFRIWIVNLLLSIATLGIYSAWAKVRRLQYFDRNTHLAGAVFDFTGKPMAILRGRILAVVLLAAYQYAFGFSMLFGVAVVLFLLASLPYLLRGALRFRLGNTRYRGMRFSFTGSTEGAYYCYLPPMMTVMLPTVAVGIHANPKLFIVVGLLYLMWPLSHGVIKAYQHQNIAFGNLQSDYEVRPVRFFVPYLVMLLIAVVGGLLLVGISAASASLGASAIDDKMFKTMLGLTLIVVGYLYFLLASCYLQVRLRNLVWTNTSFPGVWIKSELKYWPYLKLQLVNAVLTIVTVGLFRPFAVVREYEFLLASLRVDTDDSFDHIVAGAVADSDGGADGIADLAGIDLAL